MGAPKRTSGSIITGEDGLPGCSRTTIPFSSWSNVSPFPTPGALTGVEGGGNLGSSLPLARERPCHFRPQRRKQ